MLPAGRLVFTGGIRFLYVLALMLGNGCVLGSPLSDRYAKLSCAIVRIETTSGIGTGFFARSDGLLVTAGHVVYNRTYQKSDGRVTVTATPISGLKLHFTDGTTREATIPPISADDNNNAGVDLAAIRTGISAPCFIPLSGPGTLSVGDSVIALGFPASSSSGVLYSGFLSSLALNAVTKVGVIEGTDEIVSTTRNLLRVQMPITSGASGSPLIADDGTVIGVISEIPIVWTTDLTSLVRKYQTNDSHPQILISGFDTNKILSELAYVVSEFESPGAGLAVPIQYLKTPPVK
jgi:S1-C subfamily serine protease